MSARRDGSPTSTYRLQITEEFDLLAAARVLPYLHDLGVDWVYLSPILAAEADSEHGYDVADHSRIDPARGGVAGLAAVSAEARRLGMGVLVDIVPNHVGVADPAGNAWWWSVLTHGPASPYADAFDIDWAAGGGRLRHPGRRRRRRARRLPAARSATCAWRPASCTTTTTPSRSLPAAPTTGREAGAARGRRRRRARAPALRAGRAGGSPTPASTTAASSRSARWPPCASRSASGSTRPTR